MALNLKRENLHHAYCLIGNTNETIVGLKKFLEKELEFETQGNPDYWESNFDVLSIADTRNIAALHNKKPISDKKIFIVCANFITEQAQNAMLKMFEEPRGDTHFFLLMPKSGLIDTLKSRMMIVDEGGKNQSLIDAKEFLKMKAKERMREVKNLMDEISEEDKSKIEAVKFINSLETELKNKILLPKDKDRLEALEEIERVRDYAGDQSPSLKMLLEHLALILPVLKD